ncbi:hypothetical protein HQ36_02080 [Porphyromonas gingivicanis]|uniref:Uncharacterized protein n=1 Tax=Porphyromonas gingivicanis TaxID=266762 RepID=A0A0A2G7T5_9PORP|nr:hypothetical protein [Porphyromonas gingivicanis]KGN98425.1 hypothetical protein HQ36_02080 [Porphyromonas gingivicanis]
MATKRSTEVERIKGELREVMEAIGTYSPAFDSLITSCAQITALRNKTYAKCATMSPAVSEKSREGEKRQKANPVYSLYIDLCKEQRNVLASLRLTVEASGVAEDDALEELNRKLKELEDGRK